jgi:hypothetical protein
VRAAKRVDKLLLTLIELIGPISPSQVSPSLMFVAVPVQL